jgi:hypothetical protein
MSYTELDWLGDQTRKDSPFDRESAKELTKWMREDGRAIVSLRDMDALTGLIESLDLFLDDPDMQEVSVALDHWHKNRRDWERD